MNRLAKGLLILTAFALALVMWWKFNYPTHAWYQKLTVTVTTPRGDVSGASVVGVSWSKNFFSGGWGGALFHLALRGEATTIDLGGGQFLFAILGYQHSQEPTDTGLIAPKLLGDERFYWSPDAFQRVQAARGRGPVVLPNRLYPRFLRFRDINDPKTAELVDPADLAKSFGPGFRLARVTIEITDDAVTRGIRNTLPWISRQVGWFPLNAGSDVPPIGPANLIDFDTLRK